MRYLVFAGSVYYAHGGANDLAGSFDSEEEAVATAKEREVGTKYDDKWAHVYDTYDQCVVYRSKDSPYGEDRDD